MLCMKVETVSKLYCLQSFHQGFHKGIFGSFVKPNQGSHSDWKNGKMGSLEKSQGILNRPEKSGKMTPNTGKVREFQSNVIYYF